MAVVHRTVLKPTKLELLGAWLPSRPWYRGAEDGPRLARAGGFRLDDPEGEVGIEFIVATDTSGPRPATYLLPLTYRGAPLDGAEDALVGTMEHGVLGRRWAYDGCHDPVLVAQLTALIAGRAQAQDQDISDTPDPEVTASHTDGAAVPTDLADAADDRDGTVLTASDGATLRLHRVLEPAGDAPAPASDETPAGAVGHVTGAWETADGTPARAVFAVLRPGAGA
ncbi:maltokinase N-terminal cap-like domain-containing protein [Streptomyces cacaoi]|uniref:maltokinase N-terminal cap-like domain-containing protein n=1 Tax=Streptomyces cacaoi TaxID=1898 RepID=UPI0011F38682|nr:1,4-alpha-glucan branching protein [Streptomyces cacaoi]